MPVPDDRGPRWHARHAEIVDTAARLFAQRGYAATGVADLCEATGLGRGALYYYIESKEHLLAQIHDRVMTDGLTRARAIQSLEEPAPSRLRLLGAELIGVITRYPDHVWVFLHEWKALTGDLAKVFHEQRRAYEDVVRTILEDGVRDGDFVISDVRLTVLAWLGMHNYTYQWFRPGGGLEPLQIADGYDELFRRGIQA